MALRIDRDTFLERARARFGQRYCYDQIEYRSYRSPIKIRCLDHPVRLIVITPERHLQTTGGCKYCLRQYRSQAMAQAVTIPSSSSALSASDSRIQSPMPADVTEMVLSSRQNGPHDGHVAQL